MEGYALLNPRGRRRRKAKVRRARPRRRARARVRVYVNPRKRSRRRRRAYFHNPRSLKFFGVDVGAAAMVAAGAVGTGVLSNVISGLVPVEQLKSGPGRLVLKAGTVALIGFGVGNVLKQRRMGELLALGGAVSVLLDVYKMAQSALPMLPAVGEYSEVLEDYIPEVQGIGDAGAIPSPMAQAIGSPW